MAKKKPDPVSTNFYKGVYYFNKEDANEALKNLGDTGAKLSKTKRGFTIEQSDGTLLGPETIKDRPLEGTIDYQFDDALQSAVKVAEQTAAKMVTQVSKETQANIRNLVAEAIREGIPPYDAARAIVPMIGLTSAQGQAAMKYRAELIDNGLTLETVNAKVDRYAEKLLNQRAERIARTEIMDALNGGQNEAWSQAQELGLLSKNATKEWIVTPDDLLCEQCEPYDGKTVPLDQEFPEGDPPLHPSCRCTIGIGEP